MSLSDRTNSLNATDDVCVSESDAAAIICWICRINQSRSRSTTGSVSELSLSLSLSFLLPLQYYHLEFWSSTDYLHASRLGHGVVHVCLQRESESKVPHTNFTGHSVWRCFECFKLSLLAQTAVYQIRLLQLKSVKWRLPASPPVHVHTLVILTNTWISYHPCECYCWFKSQMKGMLIYSFPRF